MKKFRFYSGERDSNTLYLSILLLCFLHSNPEPCLLAQSISSYYPYSTPFFNDSFNDPYTSAPFSPNLIIPQESWGGPETTESFQSLTTDPSQTGGNYVILGDVSNGIPIGNSLFDNIPALEYREVSPTKRLPPLNIPENKEEMFTRLDLLVTRLTNSQLKIQETLPCSLLQYLLIMGVQEAKRPSPNLNLANSSANSFPIHPADAITILCKNYKCSNRRLMRSLDNMPVPTVGFSFQSQRGEFLATLARAKINQNFELNVDGKIYTIKDLVEWEKYSCSEYANLSLVAVGLSYYLEDPDETWDNFSGQEWSLSRILTQEISRPIDWNTEESTNKLIALTYLLAKLKKASSPSSTLVNTINQTETFLCSVKQWLLKLISTDQLENSLFFSDVQPTNSLSRKIDIKGRLLQWLILVSSPNELENENIEKEMRLLCAYADQTLNSTDNLNALRIADTESLVSGINALILYRRLFQKSK